MSTTCSKQVSITIGGGANEYWTMDSMAASTTKGGNCSTLQRLPGLFNVAVFKQPPSVHSGIISNGVLLPFGTNGVPPHGSRMESADCKVPYSPNSISMSVWLNYLNFFGTNNAHFNFSALFGASTPLMFVLYANNWSTEIAARVIAGNNQDQSPLAQFSTTAFFINNPAWFFLVLTFDITTSTLSLWINGVKYGSTIVPDNPALHIVTQSTSLVAIDNFLQDDLVVDEIGLYCSVLTNAQIANLWNGGAAARPAGFVQNTCSAPAKRALSLAWVFDVNHENAAGGAFPVGNATYDVAFTFPFFSEPMTGTITFTDENGPIGTAAVNIPYGVNPPVILSFTFATQPLGLHTVTAVYSGDVNYPSASLPPLTTRGCPASVIVPVSVTSTYLGGYTSTANYTATWFGFFTAFATVTQVAWAITAVGPPPAFNPLITVYALIDLSGALPPSLVITFADGGTAPGRMTYTFNPTTISNPVQSPQGVWTLASSSGGFGYTFNGSPITIS